MEQSEPRYLEAYPKLDLRAAHKHVRRGRPLLVWRNERGLVVGKALLGIGAEQRLQVHSSFRHISYIEARQHHAEIHCSLVHTTPGQTDVITFCSKCSQSVRHLYFMYNGWRCRHCQGLRHRSNIIGEEARRTERLTALEALIGAGRSKGMHSKSFLKLVDERNKLVRVLGGERFVANAQVATVLSAWFSEDGPPLVNRRGQPVTFELD